MKWFVLSYSPFFLADVGACTPYSLVSALGSVLSLLSFTIGLYCLVMKIDRDAEQKNVQNGYKSIVGFGMANIMYFSLYITTLKPLGPFTISAALMLFQKVVLKVMIPASKRCFGNDERKLWSYPVPAAVLNLELAPCLLLRGSDIESLEFWGLRVMQEANSVLKNTGKYAELYVALRAQLNRPVNEETLELMEEQRATLAPCDNMRNNTLRTVE